eukprot:Hpha_TRINITY_DN16033_c0_g1::TRINITY_DN16033_c0_g1_i2::g.121662::m.121662
MWRCAVGCLEEVETRNPNYRSIVCSRHGARIGYHHSAGPRWLCRCGLEVVGGSEEAVGGGLCELQLRKNSIGNMGAYALGRALSAMPPTLDNLELSETGILPRGCERLVTSILRSGVPLVALNLNGNTVRDEGAEALARLLTHPSQALRTLGLRGNQIGGRGGRALSLALAENASLTGLDLGENEIGDQGGRELGRALLSNETLRSLDVHANGLTPAGTKGLAAGFRGRRANETLTHLDLSDAEMDLDSARAWGEVLRRNSGLLRLNMSRCGMAVDCTGLLMDAMLANTTLCNFCLVDKKDFSPNVNHITPAMRRCLARRRTRCNNDGPSTPLPNAPS